MIDNTATVDLPGDLDSAVEFIERLRGAPANVLYNILEPHMRREGPGTPVMRALEQSRALLEEVLAHYDSTLAILRGEGWERRRRIEPVDEATLRRNLVLLVRELEGWLALERGKAQALVPTAEIWTTYLSSGALIPDKHRAMHREFDEGRRSLEAACSRLQSAIDRLNPQIGSGNGP